MTQSSLINRFLELVQIDSPSGEEQEVSTYLKKWLQEKKFSFKEDAVGNILAHRDGVGEPTLLCAHMDTVEPGRGIRPIVEDGFVKSSGDTVLGADNKAALAAIIVALEEYIGQGGKKRLEVLFTVREETGGGAEVFPFEWIEAKKGLIFDFAAPIGGVVLASPYIYNFRAVFIGKAAHGSRPEEGVNALLPAAEFILNVPQGRCDNGETTINVGKIKGGTGINIIPAEVRVDGEVRSFNKEAFERHLIEIEEEAKACAEKAGASVSFSTDGYCAGYAFKENDPWIVEIARTLEAMGFSLSLKKATNITDSNPLVDAGIAVVTLTDGVEAPHTRDERISITSLEALKRIVLAFLEKEA